MNRIVCVLEGVEVIEAPDGRVEFTADADIDADGAARAYHPGRLGLDLLANAGGPGNWWGVVTDTGERNGKPIIQGEGDPAPGYYVSATAYEDRSFARTNQRRYLDSETVPFIVVSPMIRRGVRGIVLGCRARATHIGNQRTIDCVVGDIGPTRRVGELSMAAARALGVPDSPRHGGEERRVIKYELWPGVPALLAGRQFELQRMHA